MKMLDLNTIVVISLAILAFFSLVLIIVLIPLAMQFSRTLSSMQNVIDIINYDVTPTVKEIKQSIVQAKGVLKKGSSVLQDSTSEVSILVSSAAHGLFTGVKEYLSVCKTEENGYNGNGSSDLRR